MLGNLFKKYAQGKNPNSHPKGIIPWNKGKKIPFEIWNKGKHLSEETKNRMSIIAKQKGFGKWQIGNKHSQETKNKMSLSHKWMTKENNPFWKGGRYKQEGYVLILKPDHPFANKKGYIREHRFILEKKIGRYLHRWEISHHINGIKDDNREENLLLCKSIKAHLQEHKNVRTLF